VRKFRSFVDVLANGSIQPGVVAGSGAPKGPKIGGLTSHQISSRLS
jgi:hypothetical protein